MKTEEPKNKKDSFDELTDEEKIEALIASLEEDKPREESEKTPQKETVKPSKSKPKKVEKIPSKNEPKPKSPEKKKRKNQTFLMIKIGGAFHPNIFVNFILTYFINLTLIISLMTLLFLGSFPSALWVPLVFTFVYSVSEFLYREFLMLNYTKIVIRSFGTVFYFGYVVLFYMVDQFVFSSYQIFNGEAEVAAFTGLFVIIRYLSTYVVKKGLEFKL